MQESSDLGLIWRRLGKGIPSEIQLPEKGIVGGKKRILNGRRGSVGSMVSDCRG